MYPKNLQVILLDGVKGRISIFLGEGRMIPPSIMSALIATKMLRKGREAFLADVVSIEGDVPNLVNISMVCRFPNIFLTDLPRLP